MIFCTLFLASLSQILLSILPAFLQVSNKQLLVESIMMHTVLSKRKVLLDQLRKGLETSGVLEMAERRPLLFESLFVSSGEKLSNEKGKEVVKPPLNMDEDQLQTMAHLLQFLEECCEEGT